MISWKQGKYLIQLFSIAYSFGMFLWGAIIWWVAYLFGNASVLITINEYGEMIPELFMWIIIFPIVVYGFYLNFKVVFCGRN